MVHQVTYNTGDTRLSLYGQLTINSSGSADSMASTYMPLLRHQYLLQYLSCPRHVALNWELYTVK